MDLGVDNVTTDQSTTPSPTTTSYITTTVQNSLIAAWSIAGVGILLAAVFLALLLCIKLREISCYGCQKRFKASFQFNGIDLASLYRQTSTPRDSEHSYARIDNAKCIENAESILSTSCQAQIPSGLNGQHSPGVGYGEEYLVPRVSVSNENVTGDHRISRLSGLLRSSFWSQTSADGNTQNTRQVKRNRERAEEGRGHGKPCDTKRGKQPYNGYATDGHFIPETDDFCRKYMDDGKSVISLPPVTESMVDVFQELLNPENKSLRSDLLRQLRYNSSVNDHRSRRMSRSDTDLSLAQAFAKYCGDADLESSLSENEEYYASISSVKKTTPTPKRRKSLSRKRNIEYASDIDGNASDNGDYNPRMSVKSNTISCNYQTNKLRPPVPLPRSKSLNRGQIQSSGILKNSKPRHIRGEDCGREDEAKHEDNLTEFSLPQKHLRESMYLNQVQGGYSSLNRTAQKVKKATYLDGRVIPGKEYLNVRMVVKNMSCSVEDIGLDSEFWNT